MNMTEAIAALRARNETVPIPPRLPTAAEVDAAETELGVHFHPDYRRFLLEASDIVFGTLEPAQVTHDAGHRSLVDIANDGHDMLDLPKRLLPICEDNGDYYCMRASGKSPEVIYWSHDGGSDERWDDLATWIEAVWIGENE